MTRMTKARERMRKRRKTMKRFGESDPGSKLIKYPLRKMSCVRKQS
jgi:hypothetical protein